MSIILTAATSPTLSAITTLIWTSGPSIAPVSPTQGWKLGATSLAPMSRRCSPLSPHSHRTPGPELKGSGSMQVSTTIQPTFGNPRWISHACMFYRIFYLHKKLPGWWLSGAIQLLWKGRGWVHSGGQAGWQRGWPTWSCKRGILLHAMCTRGRGIYFSACFYPLGKPRLKIRQKMR